MEIVKNSHVEKETGRLEAFSDGVFAIAITLLILELKVPSLIDADISSASLGKALMQQWPSYFSLVTSFFTIRVMGVPITRSSAMFARRTPGYILRMDACCSW